MSVQYCFYCDKLIDLDVDVEHFEMHEEEMTKHQEPYASYKDYEESELI